MAKAFEHILRRAMVALGGVVEAAIGKARKASVQVGTRGGVQPIPSLESQLSPTRIRDIVEAAAAKVLAGVIPPLQGRKALEVGEGPVLWGARMLAAEAAVVVGLETGGGSVGHQGDLSRGFVVRGVADKLPFRSGAFSYVLARLAQPVPVDMPRVFRELARVLAPGGQGMLVDFHPFGLFEKRARAHFQHAEPGLLRFEDYYRFSRQAGLRIVDVREAFVDEGMRALFRGEEIAAYRRLKGTPLILLAMVYKPKGT